MLFNDGQGILYPLGDLLHRQHKGMDGAFHALQEIDPHQLNQLIFTVSLTEYTAPVCDSHIVAIFVGATLLRAHIAERSIKPQRQTVDHLVHFTNRRELAQGINGGAFIDRL